MSSVETFLEIVVVIAILFCFSFIGYTVSDRNHCIKDGGNYSYDYGKCEVEK